MNAVGIVAEYNPFHCGHKYQLDKVRTLTAHDAVAVVMSGNFVQRGEPAIMDKWTRAEMAIQSGADLVIEIPTYFCLAEASSYARVAILLLQGLGCVDTIAFGSGYGDEKNLRDASDFLRDNSSEIGARIGGLIKEGFNYPRARQLSAEELGANDSTIRLLNSPNDALALEYLLAWEGARFAAIKRDEHSATVLRSMLMKGEDIRGEVPKCCAEAVYRKYTPRELAEKLQKRAVRLFELARYAVLERDIDVMEEAPQGGEGLSNRLKKAARSATNLDDMILMTKSKRYTYTRISRFIMQILIGIRRKDNIEPERIRVLGFNRRGRILLNYIKKYELNTLPIVTNINKTRSQEYFELDIRATDVYNMIAGRDLRKFSERIMSPIII